MNRGLDTLEYEGVSIPHLCGDEPLEITIDSYEVMYSPLVWG